MRRPIAILYEHPEWFRPLFAELERREVPFHRLHAAELAWDPGSATSPYGLVVNRMSPSAWTRGQAGVEYLISADDGLPYVYDVNALSNFVADAPTLLGFDPFVDLVDLIVRRADGAGSGDAGLTERTAAPR